MEAFSHFTYHRSGGQLIVCDLQVRELFVLHWKNVTLQIVSYRRSSIINSASLSVNRGIANTTDTTQKRRFELTDVAICSRRHRFGPTDLGEKGIDSFFHNHACNQFCSVDGHWQRPRYTGQWFPKSSSTSMIRSSQSHLLNLGNRSTFRLGFIGILEEDSDKDY